MDVTAATAPVFNADHDPVTQEYVRVMTARAGLTLIFREALDLGASRA